MNGEHEQKMSALKHEMAQLREVYERELQQLRVLEKHFTLVDRDRENERLEQEELNKVRNEMARKFSQAVNQIVFLQARWRGHIVRRLLEEQAKSKKKKKGKKKGKKK